MINCPIWSLYRLHPSAHLLLSVHCFWLCKYMCRVKAVGVEIEIEDLIQVIGCWRAQQIAFHFPAPSLSIDAEMADSWSLSEYQGKMCCASWSLCTCTHSLNLLAASSNPTVVIALQGLTLCCWNVVGEESCLHPDPRSAKVSLRPPPAGQTRHACICIPFENPEPITHILMLSRTRVPQLKIQIATSYWINDDKKSVLLGVLAGNPRTCRKKGPLIILCPANGCLRLSRRTSSSLAPDSVLPSSSPSWAVCSPTGSLAGSSVNIVSMPI